MNLAVASASGTSSPLPGSLRMNRRLAQWLKFHVDGYVEVFSGKVEIGQGIVMCKKGQAGLVLLVF